VRRVAHIYICLFARGMQTRDEAPTTPSLPDHHEQHLFHSSLTCLSLQSRAPLHHHTCWAMVDVIRSMNHHGNNTIRLRLLSLFPQSQRPLSLLPYPFNHGCKRTIHAPIKPFSLWQYDSFVPRWWFRTHILSSCPSPVLLLQIRFTHSIPTAVRTNCILWV
jgi:hypothetical protein